MGLLLFILFYVVGYIVSCPIIYYASLAHEKSQWDYTPPKTVEARRRDLRMRVECSAMLAFIWPLSMFVIIVTLFCFLVVRSVEWISAKIADIVVGKGEKK